MTVEKFRNKYRIPSARLQNWNYGWNAVYFVTICTKNREHYFGSINNECITLSNVGVIANLLWHEIKSHAKNITLGEFVVMPNHVHGILMISGNDENIAIGNDENGDENGDGDVETRHALSLQSQSQSQSSKSCSIIIQKTIGQQRFQNQGRNTLSSIVGSYKSAVTKHAHRLGFAFEWQPRFHDHIIRNTAEFELIQNYIINNPSKWTDDSFFSKTE